MINRLAILTAFLTCSYLQAEELSQPEQEILRLHSDLSNLRTAMAARQSIAAIPGQGNGTVASYESLKEAGYWFSKQNWLATLRELARYENGTQVHSTDNLLEYHYLSGKSYAAVSKYGTAVENFAMFLSESTKKGDIDSERINDVLASILDCVLKSGRTEKGFNLAPNISAILVSQEGKENIFEAYYHAGRIATYNGNNNLSREWLNNALKSPSKAVNTRSLFYKALIELSSNNLDEAYELLVKAEETAREKDLSGYHDQTVLALARIEYHRKNYNESYSWYKKISEKSSDYQTALRETIHAATAAGLYADGKLLTDSFLKLFPESESNQEIKQFQSFLTLKSSPEKATEEFYTHQLQQLASYQKEIKDLTIGKEKINEADLEKVMSKVRKFGNVGLLAKQSNNIYKKLSSLEDRSSFVMAALMEQTAWHANLGFGRVFPDDVKIANFYETKINDLIRNGDRLTKLSQFIVENELTKADREAMTRNQNRKSRLLSEENSFRRGFDNLGTWIKSRSELGKIKNSRLKNLDLLAITNAESDESLVESSAAVIKNIEKRIDHLSSQLTLEAAKNLSSLSPYLAQEKLVLQYVLAMSYDFSRSRKYFEEKGDFSSRKLKTEISEVWLKWFESAELVYQNIADSQQKLEKDLAAKIDNLNQLSTKTAEIKSRILELKTNMETAVGKSGYLLANEYLMETQSRIAETRQWMAELNLQKLDFMKKNHNKEREDYELEKQKLSEDYLDSVQLGVPK